MSVHTESGVDGHFYLFFILLRKFIKEYFCDCLGKE